MRDPNFLPSKAHANFEGPAVFQGTVGKSAFGKPAGKFVSPLAVVLQIQRISFFSRDLSEQEVQCKVNVHAVQPRASKDEPLNGTLWWKGNQQKVFLRALCSGRLIPNRGQGTWSCRVKVPFVFRFQREDVIFIENRIGIVGDDERWLRFTPLGISLTFHTALNGSMKWTTIGQAFIDEFTCSELLAAPTSGCSLIKEGGTIGCVQYSLSIHQVTPSPVPSKQELRNRMPVAPVDPPVLSQNWQQKSIKHSKWLNSGRQIIEKARIQAASFTESLVLSREEFLKIVTRLCSGHAVQTAVETPESIPGQKQIEEQQERHKFVFGWKPKSESASQKTRLEKEPTIKLPPTFDFFFRKQQYERRRNRTT